MKVLYVCSRYSDYQQNLIYSGLVHILGKSNVIDYPWNPKFHIPYKKYPRNLGYNSFRFPRPFIKMRGVDFVVVASAKPDTFLTYSKLLPHLDNVPVVFLDGGDWEQVGGDCYRLGCGALYEQIIKKRPFDIILKREYMSSLHGDDEKIIPFPFLFPFNINVDYRAIHKKHQVSFWAQQTPLIRELALKKLRDKYDCDENGTTLNQDFKTYKRRGIFYLEEISRCKIALNFRGTGWDCLRYWEIPAMNTFMISQKPKIIIPNNFIEGEHIAWCDDSLDDLFDKIDYYLKNSIEREEMVLRAKSHLNKFHLNSVRAKELVNIVSSL